MEESKENKSMAKNVSENEAEEEKKYLPNRKHTKRDAFQDLNASVQDIFKFVAWCSAFTNLYIA